MSDISKIDGFIEQNEVRLSDTTSLRLTIKSSNGKLYLDVRKWFKYPNLDDFVPSKKGLMLESDQWSTIVGIIRKMVSENSVDNNTHEDNSLRKVEGGRGEEGV